MVSGEANFKRVRLKTHTHTHMAELTGQRIDENIVSPTANDFAGIPTTRFTLEAPTTLKR